MLATMIFDHAQVDYKQDPPRTMSATARAIQAIQVPSDVYDPDRDGRPDDVVSSDELATNIELMGLADFVEVEI